MYKTLYMIARLQCDFMGLIVQLRAYNDMYAPIIRDYEKA